MDERTRVIARLHELRRKHEAAIGEGPGEAYGFIQDEQSTRKSYKLVAADALSVGVLTAADLESEGLSSVLEQGPLREQP